MRERTNVNDGLGCSAVANHASHEGAEAHGTYSVECYDADGNLKWSEFIENLVTTGGKNYAFNNLMAGSSYTAAWYIGLVDGSTTPTPAAADTMASHSGWTENQSYSQTARPTAAWGAAAAGAISLSTALTFSINASSTIAGCFLTTSNTKGGTAGTLYSAGTFTGGNKVLQSGDTLNVSYTASM